MSLGMKFLLDQQGKCTSCAQAVAAGESITCCSCSLTFHAHSCSAYDKQEAICTATLLKLFSCNTTKSNFKWFCDSCLTKFEVDKATTVQDRFHEIISQVSRMAKDLDDVKKTVMNSAISSIPGSETCCSGHTSHDAANNTHTGSAWQDVNRVRDMRSSLVLKSKPGDQDPVVDLDRVKSLAIQNKILVAKVGVSHTGHTFIQCPTVQDRDKLQPLLTAGFEDKEVVALKEKLPHISIVDIARSQSDDITSTGFKADLLNQIRNQNHQIDALIETGHEFNILFVKAGRDANKCTAVVRVSCKIRDAIKAKGHKVFIGICSCRVFDRFFIKRCNKCHGFGHYKGECTNPEVCGYCGGEHSSESCNLKEMKDHTLLKCVNCKRMNLPDSGHSAFWPGCPVYTAAQNRLRSTIPYYDGKKSGRSSLNA